MDQALTSPSEENYLEWIYRFSQDGPVRPKDLAAELGIKPPSVTKALTSLVKKGYVSRGSRRNIGLTDQGKAVGEAMVRRGNCLTTLLVDILDMPPEIANPETHRLEHALSDEVLMRLEALVDFTRSSPAWVKRLHIRINQLQTSETHQSSVLVGQTPNHAGFHRKQNSQNGKTP